MENQPINSPWGKLELLDLSEYLRVLIAEIGDLLVLDPVDGALGVWVFLCPLNGGAVEVYAGTYKHCGVSELIIDPGATVRPLMAAV